MKKRIHLFWASLGLVFVGAGLSIAIDAGLSKALGSGGLLGNWVVEGTIALIIFNSGLSFFGRAIIEQVKAGKRI